VKITFKQAYKKIFMAILYRFDRLASFLRIIKYSCYPQVTIGKNCYIGKSVELHIAYGGNIIIGDNCELHSGSKLLTYGGNIIIGNNSTVNPFTTIYGQGNTTIGSGVRIAAQSTIIPSNHNFAEREVPIYLQGLTNKGIVIEDDVWIGTGVRVLDGVTIRKGCILAAGAVVNKSTDSYCIYAGVPARMIKKR